MRRTEDILPGDVLTAIVPVTRHPARHEDPLIRTSVRITGTAQAQHPYGWLCLDRYGGEFLAQPQHITRITRPRARKP